MTDLDPDVRADAEKAAYEAFTVTPGRSGRARWDAVVDAVAEVLVAGQPPEIDWKTAYDQREVEINQILTDSGGQIMQLRARVEQLTAALTELVERCSDYTGKAADVPIFSANAIRAALADAAERRTDVVDGHDGR